MLLPTDNTCNTHIEGCSNSYCYAEDYKAKLTIATVQSRVEQLRVVLSHHTVAYHTIFQFQYNAGEGNVVLYKGAFRY